MTQNTSGGVGSVDPIFVSVKEAARILGGLTTWSIYRLCDDQILISQYHGRRRLVRLDSLRDYAANLPTQPPAA